MKIFFQGDSITDAGRDRSDNHNLGSSERYISINWSNPVLELSKENTFLMMTPDSSITMQSCLYLDISIPI